MKFPVCIDTFGVEDPDEIIHTRTFDHDNHDSRVWFSNHLYWAIRNNHAVEVTPLTDGDDK